MKFITKWIETLSSKKFWIAIAAVAAYIANDESGQAWPIVAIGAIYVAVQAYVDGLKVKNGVS